MALADFGVSGEGRNREEISGRSNPGSCSLPVAHPKEAAGGHGNSQGKVWLGEKSGDAGEGLGTLSLKQLSQPEMRQHAALVRFVSPSATVLPFLGLRRHTGGSQNGNWCPNVSFFMLLSL